jgi:hypothetical protein
MSTSVVRTQNGPGAYQNVLKLKEEREMKKATKTTKVNMRLSDRLAKTPAKLLGGLALGALVMAATALPLGTTYAYELTRPLISSEQFDRIEVFEALGIPWRIDDQGNVVEVRQKPTAMSVSELFEVWFQDDPNVPIHIYHLLKHGNEVKPSRAIDYSLVDWEETSLDLAERQAFSPS